MQGSHVDPHSIVKPKKSWLPLISGEKIIQFLKAAYRLDDDEYQKLDIKEQNKFPSIGRKVS